MLLRESMRKQGNWLFCWRSYLPVVLLPAAALAAWQSGGFERWLGQPLENYWEIVCLVVAFAGLFLRAMTIGIAPRGTSGRNTTGQRADVLNTTGIYSVVRNPLYLGNLLMIMGLALLPGVWWFVALVGLVFFIYYERIIYAEEAFLEEKFGAVYRQWAARTPVIVPNPWLWRPSTVPFCFRNVLKREYSGFYVIVAFSTGVELMCDLLGFRQSFAFWMQDNFSWILFFIAGTVLFLVLRLLKRHTSLLRVSKEMAGSASLD